MIISEEDAVFYKPSGSVYVRIPSSFKQYAGIEETKDGEIIKSDHKVAIAIGKHGKFILLYSPEDQKQWQKEKAREEKNQQKL
jgi:sucrose-6-phosphate hydrolase SacC (GH32 family)